jgi:hypothetical protein
MKIGQCGLRFAVRSGAYLCESASHLIGCLSRRAREKISGFTMRQIQSRKLHENLNTAQQAHSYIRKVFSNSGATRKFFARAGAVKRRVCASPAP